MIKIKKQIAYVIELTREELEVVVKFAGDRPIKPESEEDRIINSLYVKGYRILSADNIVSTARTIKC